MYGKVNIIDRTLPEIVKTNTGIDKKALTDFIYLLNASFDGYFEIDKNCVDILRELPHDINFIYRVQQDEDFSTCRKYKFKHLIFTLENLQNIMEYKQSNEDCKLTLEICKEDAKEVYEFFNTHQHIDFKNLHSIRITGLSSCIPWDSDELFDFLRGYNLKVDICPEDKYYCASAVALEAVNRGTDYVTLCFCGRGGNYGWAALEEVIMAAKFILNLDIEAVTSIYPQIKLQYEKCTGYTIEAQKPILGTDIFKCESGIHVDGISKNPETYEPYSPETVGLRREILIGKHSGLSALKSKLEALSIDTGKINLSKLLCIVRDKSIDAKGNISDGELSEIVKSAII